MDDSCHWGCAEKENDEDGPESDDDQNPECSQASNRDREPFSPLLPADMRMSFTTVYLHLWTCLTCQ